MSHVSGSILVSETGLGVPGLIVRIQHTDSVGVEADATSPRNDNGGPILLATAITNENGTFAVSFERPDVRENGRFNLQVGVFAPANRNLRRTQDAPLATQFRPRSDSRETFVILVKGERLRKAHVEVPESDRTTETVVARRRGASTRTALLNAGARGLFADRLKQQLDKRRRAKEPFQRFLAALSAVPEEKRTAANSRYVQRGASVHAANREAIKASMGAINQSAAIGFAALSAAERAQFTDASGHFIQRLAAADVEPVLGLTLSPTRVRRDFGSLCRDEPVDDCVLILEGKEVPPPDPPVDPSVVVEPDTSVVALIDKLVKDMQPPEAGLVFGLNGRATLSEVNENVKAFAPHGGPADGPALYDFHHLRIAFEDVWQELFDIDLETKGQQLYEQFVELGLDPNEYLLSDAIMTSLGKGALTLAETVKTASQDSTPPVSVVSAFNITPAQWNALAWVHPDAPLNPAPPANKSSDITTFFGLAEDEEPETPEVVVKTAQERLVEIAVELNTPLTKDFWDTGNEAWLQYVNDKRRLLRRQGENIIAHVTQDEVETSFEQFHPLLKELGELVKQPYRFTIYAANDTERSVNFGAVVTYRQRWMPVAYQPGKLVKTVPLAPKEVRRFTKKSVVKQSRAEKEVASSLHSRKTEITETTRVETAIVEKAQNKTNFQMSAKGGLKVAGIGEASATAGASHSAATESHETKKAFREAVVKATEEYKSERSIEVNVTDSYETQSEESGEISNPNDEIPVTYLFYELQRRFTVSEQIHRLTPVVLVAQEFPNPADIDEDWIVAHDWILRRVILDDTFVPAMDYLATKVTGDEVSLQEMFNNVELQRRVADDLKEGIIAIRGQAGRRYAALERSIERRARAVDAEEREGFIEEGVEFVFGSVDPESPEAARVREDAARDAYEREAKHEKEVLARLERETTALTSLTEVYTKSLSEHLNRKAQIARLRVHLKANIMYLHARDLESRAAGSAIFPPSRRASAETGRREDLQLEPDPDAVPGPPDWEKPVKIVMKVELDPELEFEPLHEVADLDNLLGFKGNYMIFALKQRNDLTDFLALPFIDRELGLSDPDPLGNWTMTDLVEYVCCLRKSLSAAEFERLLPGLVEAYQRILADGGTEEEIVVPTDSLFIEALTGAHSLLEDFKLLHRAIDVRKVQADVRAIEFENVRFAARLREGEREDPTIEKRIIVEGTGSFVTPVDG